MTAIPNPGGPFLTIYPTVGPVIPTTSAGVILAPGTYLIPFGADGALVSCVQLQWDATFAATLTIEDSCNPDLPIATVAAGTWTPENPPTAYVGGAGVGGLTVSAATMVIAGGTAGSLTLNIGNTGAPRNRIKAIVTTQGRLTPSAHNKA